MTKYEVIEYEVRADPVAKPVASSTERFEPRNQPASYLFKRECHVEQFFLAFTRGWNRFGSD